MSDAGALVLAQSARALQLIAFGGRSADVALKLEGTLAPSVRAITLGSLRWYGRLDALLVALLGATRVTPVVHCLLLASMHQLEYSRNPREATVSSAVDAVRVLDQPRASGLVNALLRRYLREREALSARALRDEASACAHPRWLLDALQAHWPAQWRQVVALNNTHPPMTLRVNLTRTSRAEYQASLAAADLESRALDWMPAALLLQRPVPVHELPGFAQGLVSVQDAGAQLAAPLLAARPGQRVLDACAAPGGKTGAILEGCGGELALTAADIDEARLGRVADNLERLGFKARLRCADLREPGDWWDGERFDRILVDAPCSATGVIRRHPDIKLLRRERDSEGFVASQRRILEHTLAMLKPGGRLLYATCSLLPEENEQLVQQVLDAGRGACPMPLLPAGLDPGVALPPQAQTTALGAQLLPTDAAPTDGFYYACLTVS